MPVKLDKADYWNGSYRLEESIYGSERKSMTTLFIIELLFLPFTLILSIILTILVSPVVYLVAEEREYRKLNKRKIDK